MLEGIYFPRNKSLKVAPGCYCSFNLLFLVITLLLLLFIKHVEVCIKASNRSAWESLPPSAQYSMHRVFPN